MSFVYNNGTLNGSKTNLGELPLGADPNQWIQANEDWNPTIQAIYDLRDAIIANEFLGLTRQSSAPAVPTGGASDFFWLNTSGQLFLRIGSNSLLIPTAYAVRTADAAIDVNAILSLSTSTAGRLVMTPAGADPDSVIAVAVSAAAGAASTFLALELRGMRAQVLTDGSGAVATGTPIEVSNATAGRIQPPSGGRTLRYSSSTGAATPNTLVEVQW